MRTVKDVGSSLRALADKGCVTLYEIGGRPYFYFPNWSKHQRVRDCKPKYPEPTEDSLRQVAADCGEAQQSAAIIQSNPIQSESESKSKRDNAPAKHAYGEFDNVLLTDAELDKLKNRLTDWAEHPFSIQEYQKQNNVDNPFGEMIVQEGQTGNAYLFTADETRYNIAPTSASEHRNYAFYHMEVDVIKKTYTPAVELTPLYGTTCYDGDAELAHYGVKITTINEDKTPVEGYLTSEQIATAINNKIAEAGISASQILYVDASELLNVYQPDKLKELQAKLGKNALLYLPQYTTLASNNCATKTLAGTFTSCSNIILTDKHPFYAPYDISVSASDYVKYDRMMTVVNSQEYGQSANATIMLPFTLNLDDSQNVVLANNDVLDIFQGDLVLQLQFR